MKKIAVTLSYVGNLYAADFFVPADEDLKKFKQILECQPVVVSFRVASDDAKPEPR